MPEARLGAGSLDPRLCRVELPWMEIEHRRPPVDGVDASDRPLRYTIRQQPEIAAAAGRPVRIQHPDRRHRDLEHVVAHLVREARRVRRAVVIVPYRVDARAVPITGFGDAIEGPEIGRPDRKARRPVAVDLASGDVFEHRLGQADIGQESADALLVGSQVLVTVAGELVATIDQPPDQRRVALCYPAERKKGRADFGFGEQPEDPFDIGLDPAGLTVP